MSSNFVAKTTVFEGPLELLLTLIEDRKLSINEVSLSQITDDYLAHIKENETINQNALSEFILVAATLILIKSKSLLPELPLLSEEQSDISDLEKRLKLYQYIRTVCKPLATRFDVRPLLSPKPKKDIEPVFVPDPLLTLISLLQSVTSVLKEVPLPKEKKPETTVRKVIELKEIIRNLLTRIKSEVKIRFSSVTGTDGSKEEKKTYAIVSFLAVLELIKTGELFVEQSEVFGDMMLSVPETTV